MGNKHIQNTKKFFPKPNRRSNIIKCAISIEHNTFKGPLTMFNSAMNTIITLNGPLLPFKCYDIP